MAVTALFRNIVVVKIERIVLALFIAAILAVAASVYYAFVNFSTTENTGYSVRHTHHIIEGVYQIEFQATVVENSSDKFIMSREPYYAVSARQNALTLNASVDNLIDSVKDNPLQLQRMIDLRALVMNMERNLPGVDSNNLDMAAAVPKIFRAGPSENYIDNIIAKANEIANEEFRLLTIRRNTANESQKNTIHSIYFTAAGALLFIFFILISLNADIRQRRVAEIKIRENEEKLRLMVEEVGDVIFSSDPEGRFTFINSRLESLTGYAIDELVGKHFTFLVHPEWIEKVKEFYLQQFKSQIYETRYEFPILTKQGTTKWVEQNVVMIRKGKRIVSFQCVGRDITQRKDTEEEIRRTNQFLDSVLENIPNMIFIKDANDLRFLRFNKAGEKLLGYLQEDLLGKNDYDFFPKEQADFFTFNDKKVLTSHAGLDISEEPVKTRNGTRWLHTKKIPVYDSTGKPLYLLGISEDITERKKTEDTIIELNKNLARYVAELEESQRFYKTIARNFPDGTITVLDRNLNYIFVDGRELALEGLNADELLGRPYLNRYPAEIKHEIKSNLLDIFKGNNATFDVTLSGQNYVMHGVPLENTGGVVNEILLVKQNITKLKVAEENMRMALEKEKLINELKSRFVTLASHEFRTPLSTILSSTELIGEYIEHDGENAAIIKEKNRKHLKRIKTSIQNMVSILNSFLSLEQLEQGKATTHPTHFDVKDFSNEIIDEIQSKLKNGQKIKYIHNTSDSQVFMDHLMLKNVVLNLLANAIKYSPENSSINYTTFVSTEGLEFTVEDHGIGIPENEQSNLFERFFRAKNTLNIEGTGLGLSIVKKYIDILNGHISFYSRENEGSTFKVFVVNAIPSDENNIVNKEKS